MSWWKKQQQRINDAYERTIDNLIRFNDIQIETNRANLRDLDKILGRLIALEERVSALEAERHPPR